MAAKALAGVKILDFTWVMAGPAASRVLADYGATIVRVESSARVDTGRTLQPFVDGRPGLENSTFFHNVNAGKLMLSLDLKKPEARAIVLDLVRWADVVMESFSPKAMKGFGFDYESLVKVKPDLVMVSTCLMGQTGPLARFAGYGNLAAAITGFVTETSWPDRPPAGPFSAYTDYVAPRYTVCAVLAALDHRRRTGEGQSVDQSQAESAMHFLAPALLDTQLHGDRAPRGNRDSNLAPHGVYPAAGDDRWVAIVAQDDAAWARLARAIGRAELATAPAYATAAARVARADELDALLAEWTRGRDEKTVEAELQAAGVACSVVQNSIELAADPQLAHRGHFVPLEHASGKAVVEGSRMRFSRTPAQVSGSAPTLGRDNFTILEKILGYSEEKIGAIAASGALE